jgi:hypothetical protein
MAAQSHSHVKPGRSIIVQRPDILVWCGMAATNGALKKAYFRRMISRTASEM